MLTFKRLNYVFLMVLSLVFIYSSGYGQSDGINANAEMEKK